MYNKFIVNFTDISPSICFYLSYKDENLLKGAI